MGAQTIDCKGRKEPRENTQRFRIYMNLLSRLFGEKTFAAHVYRSISGCLLVNKRKFPDSEIGKDVIIGELLKRYDFEI